MRNQLEEHLIEALKDLHAEGIVAPLRARVAELEAALRQIMAEENLDVIVEIARTALGA